MLCCTLFLVYKESMKNKCNEINHSKSVYVFSSYYITKVSLKRTQSLANFSVRIKMMLKSLKTKVQKQWIAKKSFGAKPMNETRDRNLSHKYNIAFRCCIKAQDQMSQKSNRSWKLFYRSDEQRSGLIISQSLWRMNTHNLSLERPKALLLKYEEKVKIT